MPQAVQFLMPAGTAGHLIDHVIPHVPVHQGVLSLPIPLRLLLAAQPKLPTPTKPARRGKRGRQGMPRKRDFNQTLCADSNGFSLHAAVRCAADDRQALQAT